VGATATRAVTSSPVWYGRFCNAWEWARCAPHPFTCSWMTWSSATSNSQGAPMKSHCMTPEGMVHQTAHLPPWSQGIHSRYYGLDPG
jgi:hypothetical protein